MKKRMQLFRTAGVIIAICSLLLVLIGTGEAGAKETRVTFGTTNSTSGMYPWLCAHATEVNKRTKDVYITAVESPNSVVENALRIRAGEMHLGWGGAGQMYRTTHGLGEFKGKACPDIRAVACVIETPFTLFVTKESGIKSIYELEGKPFGTSFPGSITALQARTFFDSIGVKPKYFEASLGACMEGVRNRTLVGFVKTGAPDSSILDVASGMPIRILSISKEDYAKCEAKYPDIAEGTCIIRAGTYPGQTEDVLTYTFYGTFQSTAKLSADAVYQIVKAWYDARKDLGAMYAAANKERGELGFPKLTMETSKVPLHAGAYKFYKELGLKIPEKIIPPEAK